MFKNNKIQKVRQEITLYFTDGMFVCTIVFVTDYMIMTMITIAPGHVRRDTRAI